MALNTIKVKLPSGQIQKVKVPDDWDQDKIAAEMKKHFPIEEKFSEKLAQDQPERTGVTGLISDLGHATGNAIQGASRFAAATPQMLEDLGGELLEHPVKGQIREAAQLGAGAADVGKTIVNAPHDLLKYFIKKHLAFDIPIPGTDWHTSDLIPHIQEDTGLEKALGLEPTKGEKLVRKIPEIASDVAGGRALLIMGKKALKAPDLKQSIRDTQGKVNQATSESGKIFDKVEEAVEDRGISKVPIDNDIIDMAETFLAKTPANKKMIENARTGDYKALRALQADLRVKGEKALSSALTAENNMGEEILSTRDLVNESIQNHFENTGNKDLAKDLNKTRNDYRNIQKTYFSTPQLAKVFGKSQKVPTNPLTLLREESTEMKKFMLAHPEVEKALIKALKHEGRVNMAKNVGKAFGIGTASEVMRKILGGH